MLENKEPQYNKSKNIFLSISLFRLEFSCYVLKFIHRHVRKSSKNFQLIFSINTFEIKNSNQLEDNILLQFAEAGDNTFILDYKHPFTNLLAFAIGIISLASKKFCE